MQKYAKVIERSEITDQIFPDGSEERTQKTVTSVISASTEPSFVKLYVDAWANLDGLPDPEARMLLELAKRMSYADEKGDPQGGQTVFLDKYTQDSIMNSLNVKKSRYYVILKHLQSYGIIRQLDQRYYQVSPYFAGRGEWAYNAKFQRGGVKGIFDVYDWPSPSRVKEAIQTQTPIVPVDSPQKEVLYADAYNGCAVTSTFREGLGISSQDAHSAVMLTAFTKPAPDPPDPPADSIDIEDDDDDVALPFDPEYN